MTTTSFSVDTQQRFQGGNALAIMFFLLGLPNVYGVLRRQAHSGRSRLSRSLFGGFVLLTITLSGTAFCLW